MPLRASHIRSLAHPRWTSVAAAALWIAAALSFVDADVRVQLASTSRLMWPALASLVVGIALAVGIASGSLSAAIRQRLSRSLPIFSAPAFMLVVGSGGVRSPSIALAGVLTMCVTAAAGYRRGALVAALSVITIGLADTVLGRAMDAPAILSAAALVIAIA